MKDVSKLALRLVLGLIVVLVGGWIVGGAINLGALLSPQMVSRIDCPSGSTAKTEWIQQSFDQPGQKTLTISCLNAAGNSVQPLTDAQSRAIGYRYFFPIGVGVMLVIVVGWFAAANLRRTRLAAS